MPSEFVEAAAEAALKVGELLLAMLPEARTSKEIRTKRNPTDLVTRADRISEDLIVGLLRERFPDHGILAEEGSQHPCAKFVVPSTGSMIQRYSAPGC